MAKSNSTALGRFQNMSKEEVREIARKGGIQSGKSKRRQKESKQIMQTFLTMPISKGKIADVEKIKAFMELKGKNITTHEAIMLKTVQMALKGDLDAINMILKIIGEQGSDKVDVNANVNNPFADLTTEELRELISQDEE